MTNIRPVSNLIQLLSQSITLFLLTERQVLKAIGSYLADSPIRKDPVTCAEKEKEGEFDFDAEMAQIEQALQQVHGPTAGQAAQES